MFGHDHAPKIPRDPELAHRIALYAFYQELGVPMEFVEDKVPIIPKGEQPGDIVEPAEEKGDRPEKNYDSGVCVVIALGGTGCSFIADGAVVDSYLQATQGLAVQKIDQ